jgi:hypothetical protein
MNANHIAPLMGCVSRICEVQTLVLTLEAVHTIRSVRGAAPAAVQGQQLRPGGDRIAAASVATDLRIPRQQACCPKHLSHPSHVL